MSRRGAVAIVALIVAGAIGLASAAAAQLSAAPVADPRPSHPVATAAPSGPGPSATTSATPAPSPTPPDPVWLYIVQSGDSISGVAIRFGTTVEAILLLNPAYVDNENLVQAGASLVMPCTPLARTEGRCG